MRFTRIMLLLPALLAMHCALGDIAPYPSPHPVPLPSPAPAQPKAVAQAVVSMEKADVRIRVTRQGNRAIADVYAKFFMLCHNAPEYTAPFDTAFPVNYAGQPGSTRFFHVTVDGTLCHTDPFVWHTTDERQQAATANGYSWMMPIHGGKQALVIVHYACALPLTHGQAPFMYFLRSGATWDGVIGQESVLVQLGKGMSLALPSSAKLKPLRKSARDASWKLVQVKPTEDIHFTILRSR